jgi:DNA-binding NarL/FixJ family response regulator
LKLAADSATKARKPEQSEFQPMINVIIADHQAIFRAGIAKVLAVEEDIRIVGQPQSSEQLLNALEKLRTRVLILSTSFLPQFAEIQAIAGGRNVALLMLVENTETASDFMRMGVQGAIYRCAGGNVVVEAVRRLSRGESFLQSPNMEGDVSEDFVGARVRDRLSDRELRIISAVVQGFKNRDIAMQLYTSEQMVKNALRNIFDKIGVSDRLELALFTIHHRILAQATASVPVAPSQRRNGVSVTDRGTAATSRSTAVN